MQNPRSAQEAHENAMLLPIESVVRELVDLLGLTTVAVIGGVKETRAVNQWMEGREPQRPHVLRFALQVASMISTVADRSIAQAWFQGSNPHLDGRSPAVLLYNRPSPEVQRQILAAAELFAARSNATDHGTNHNA
jgi:hypothetical protein